MTSDTVDAQDICWTDSLPKAELHVHLEGCLPVSLARKLAQRHGLPTGVYDVGDLYRHRDFPDFIEHFKALVGLLQTPDDLRALMDSYVELARASHIVYAEVHFTPYPLLSANMSYGAMMETIQASCDVANGDGIVLRIILDTVRQLGPEHCEQTLQAHLDAPFPCVVGIGIGGDETSIPPGPFRRVFERARERGLRTVCHCGETGNPESMWETMQALKPQRVLHGIQAVRDPGLLDWLAENKITLDVCPTSNVKTGVVPSLEEHPLKKLVDSGVRVTINTDDPALFQTNLNREYRLIQNRSGIGRRQVLSIAEEAFRAALSCPPLAGD